MSFDETSSESSGAQASPQREEPRLMPSKFKGDRPDKETGHLPSGRTCALQMPLRETWAQVCFDEQGRNNIRWKLQKFEGFDGKNATELISVATQVYINSEQEKEKTAKRKTKEKPEVVAAAQAKELVAALASREDNFGRGRGHGCGQDQGRDQSEGEGQFKLGRNQCVICKKEGHWKRDCPNEDKINIQAQGAKKINFMVDTGAEHSVVTQPIGPLTKTVLQLLGLLELSQRRPFCSSKRCAIAGREIQNEFLYSPDCPVPLLGRDLLPKFQAQISFTLQGNVTLSLGQPKAVLLTITYTKAEE
ncbi:Gag-Pol polyprotein [Plecturocebus cupreus]